MRFVARAACLAVVALVGCGQSEPVLPQSKAPHGGTVVALPDGLGNAEFVREEVPGTPPQTKLFIYFIDSDGKPIAAAPTDATLKLKERRTTPVSFKPTSGADPATAGALASAPFAINGDIAGELTATVGGKPVTVSVNVR